jgi:uncharacterized membrane protein (UPF0127 family)
MPACCLISGVKRVGCILLVAACCAGCQKSSSRSLPSESERFHLDQAQSRLPTVTLWLGQEEMIAEVCRSAVQIHTGMMFRTNLPENEGMLFVFPQPYQASFYMRNTVVPLSCAYLDREGTILEIHPLEPLSENPVSAATDQVQFVLETRQGWFDRHGITTGAVVTTSQGSLKRVFGGRL